MRDGVFHRSWPLLERAAIAHRATLARQARAVAVVGSLGKTTTARAVAAVLGRDPDDLGRNYRSYLAAAVMRIRRGDRHAVLEAGIAERGIMCRYARMVRPDLVVVTSIGTEHQRAFPSLEVTRDEKAEMVRALEPTGVAVLNGDDDNVLWMAGQTAATVRSFGFGEHNDVRATGISVDWPHGMRFTLHAAGSSREVRVRLLGRHMVLPALAAVAVALEEGVALDAAVSALESLAPTPGRLEIVPLANGATLVRDDFKATADTLDSALDVLAEIPAERKTVVLSDVEDSPEDPTELYERVGARVGASADRAVFVHFYEAGPRYAPSAREAGLPSESIVDARGGVHEAAEAGAAGLGPGDVVFVKGSSPQRLDRVSLALMGRIVRCELRHCEVKVTRCAACPMLERGWEGRRKVL